MIIECSACQAKFRLDESKIKGKGARVRCRKCGTYIIVMRPEGEAAPPPSRPESLDLRSAIGEELAPPPPRPAEMRAAPPVAPPAPPPIELRAAPPVEPPIETHAESPAPPPVEAALPPVEMTSPPVEVAAPPLETAAPPVEEAAPPVERPAPPVGEKPFPAAAPDTEKDEVDLAFEKFLAGTQEPPAEPPPAASAPTPQPLDALEFAPEEKIELPAPAEAPRDFVLSDADTLGFLQEAHKKDAEEPEKLDISSSLTGVPMYSLEGDLRPPSPPPAEAPSAAEPPPPLEKTESEGGPIEGLESRAETPAAERQAPEPPLLPPPPAAEPRRPAPSPVTPFPRPAAARPVYARPGVIALILLFLCLAGGGWYLGFTTDGQAQLKRLVPNIESLLGRGGKAAPGPSYDVRNLIGYIETNASAGRLFVIKGQVANVGRTKKSGIRIKASLLDDKDQSVAEQTSYAGNILAGDTLRQADRGKIDAAMGNRLGDRLANVDVPPGKSIPFMVVFINPPEGVSAYRLEAVDGE